MIVSLPGLSPSGKVSIHLGDSLRILVLICQPLHQATVQIKLIHTTQGSGGTMRSQVPLIDASLESSLGMHAGTSTAQHTKK